VARRAAKIDASQPAIVAALKAVGCSVQSLAAIGKGCPDLLAYKAGEYWLIEVKDGARPPSERGLRDTQTAWHAAWAGPVHVVNSVVDALALVCKAA
jgi:hypothetical protein